MAVQWVRVGQSKRKVHVLANRAWQLEREALEAARPIIIVLHDELVDATPIIGLLGFAGAVYSPGSGILTTPLAPPPAARGGGEIEPAPISYQQVDTTHGHFVVIVPEGLQLGIEVARPDGGEPTFDPRGSWNSGHRGYDAMSYDTDDVAAIEHILHEVLLDFQAVVAGHRVVELPVARSKRALDPTQVFVVGIGNGGEMAFRLAVELGAAAAAAGREYSVVVRGVGVYGASHRGTRLGGGPLSEWTPIDPDRVLVAIHDRADVDFFWELPPGAVPHPSEAVAAWLFHVGEAEVPPASVTGKFATNVWGPPVGAWLQAIGPSSSVEVAVKDGVRGVRLDFEVPDTGIPPINPGLVFWNVFAANL